MRFQSISLQPMNLQPMRLDKYVSQALSLTRTEARKLIKQRRISHNQKIVTDIATKIPGGDQVAFDNNPISIIGKRYLVLNKPAGYICSTQNEEYPSALNLINDSSIGELHFAGRLDVDTTGLVLVSDDGQWTHRVTSPRQKCEKVYRVCTARDIDECQIKQLTEGVMLRGEKKKTLEAKVTLLDRREILLVISEGRYHQVKRMLAAVGNHVLTLHREQIGQIGLTDLNLGEWRELTPAEVSLF